MNAPASPPASQPPPPKSIKELWHQVLALQSELEQVKERDVRDLSRRLHALETKPDARKLNPEAVYATRGLQWWWTLAPFAGIIGLLLLALIKGFT